MLMKTGFQIVALACCLLAAQGSPDTPCFTRELCSAPCYACSTPLNGVLCLNQSDLAEASGTITGVTGRHVPRHCS